MIPHFQEFLKFLRQNALHVSWEQTFQKTSKVVDYLSFCLAKKKLKAKDLRDPGTVFGFERAMYWLK